MWNIISYNFNLLEIFVDIINHKHCLIISAKYQSFNINDACTMSLGDMSATPQKLYGQLPSF